MGRNPGLLPDLRGRLTTEIPHSSAYPDEGTCPSRRRPRQAKPGEEIRQIKHGDNELGITSKLGLAKRISAVRQVRERPAFESFNPLVDSLTRRRQRPIAGEGHDPHRTDPEFVRTNLTDSLRGPRAAPVPTRAAHSGWISRRAPPGSARGARPRSPG